jgi:hypothetical protein
MRKSNVVTVDAEAQEELERKANAAAHEELYQLITSLDDATAEAMLSEIESESEVEALELAKKWLAEKEAIVSLETSDTISSEPIDMKGVHRMDWWQLYMDRAEPRNSAEIAVAGVLLRHFNSHTGEAFPSVNTIAAEAKCRKGAAQEAINRMRTLGFVKTKPGKRNSETYQMSLPPDLANVVLLEYERRQREQRNTYSERRRHG